MHDLDRAGRPVGTVDGMIAATALVEGAQLATLDRKGFSRVPGLALAETTR